ncbi:hypothetical protein MK489_06730 [Myxococcota bacterium]|nr:hypothetical protein [Myxococcota bacterium]
MTRISRLLSALLLSTSLIACAPRTEPARDATSEISAVSPIMTPGPWTGCFLPEPPPGSCGEAWGRSDSLCDPDRFLNHAAFAFAPDAPPPGFPLSAPLPVQWQIFIREDGTGDVSDEVLEERLAQVNRLFAPAGFTLATAGVNRHERPELATCRVKVTPGLVTDPNYPVCGDGAPYQLSHDPERNINAYIVDLVGPTAFALDPCIFPPGDERDGIYINRSVFEGSDKAVLAHELGHYFGLLHTFHTWRWNEPGENPVCEDADNDFVEDTLPQRSYLELRDVDCDNPPTTCPGSDQPDLLTNIMQYSACLTAENGTFTPGQLRRMQWKLATERPGLLPGS